MGECKECGYDTDFLFRDYRVPPLGTFNCLCRDCAVSAAVDRLEEVEAEMNEINQFVKQL
jgi:hypothetical protein